MRYVSWSGAVRAGLMTLAVAGATLFAAGPQAVSADVNHKSEGLDSDKGWGCWFDGCNGFQLCCKEAYGD